MMEFVRYFFWPNPVAPQYNEPKVLLVLFVCLALIAASFVIKRVRTHSKDAQFKKLSSSWPSAMFWFGGFGLLFLIARTENISYISMRLWWVVWLALVAVFIVFQIRQYRSRYYKVVPTKKVRNKNARYLPTKKK